jgi:hypothetical protein
MRKVLLATTALVAVGGVSVANAADISISGNYEFEYRNSANGATVAEDGNVVVNASTTSDAGVTYAVTQNFDGDSAATTVEAAYITISSAEMGTLYLGDADDSAPTMMDGALGINNDIESEYGVTATSTVTGMANNPDITYISPNVAGLTFGLSSDVNTGNSAYAVTYSMAGLSVFYGVSDESSSVGAKGSLAGFTVAAGSKSNDGSRAKSADIAVKYTLDNGITLAALSANGTDANGNKSKYSNIGASYGITDGVTLKLEAGDGTDGNYSTVNLTVSY